MVKRKKKPEPQPQQYTTLAVGEDALDRDYRGIDIKPIKPSDQPAPAGEQTHRRRRNRGEVEDTTGEGGDDGQR